MRLGGQQSKYWLHSRLYLLAYAFLLRLPSEAVLAVAGTGENQAQLFYEGRLGYFMHGVGASLSLIHEAQATLWH